MVVEAPSAAASRAAAAHRFIALDSLRGLAALVIVFYHMGDFGWVAGLPPFRYGWMLVDFFFILSGFVITWSYGERLAMGYPRTGFVMVRLGRMYPLHIATVLLFVILEFALFRPVLHEAHSLTELLRGVFLLDAFRTGAGNFYAPVSWAVAVELVLYLIAAAFFGRGRWAIAISALLAAISAWALWTGFNVTGFGRLLQRGLLAFPLGVLACWLYRRMEGRKPGALLASIMEIALFALLVWLLCLPGKYANWIPCMDMLFLVMVLVFAWDAGIVSRVLQWQPLVTLGTLSFALYMVHLFYVILPNRLLPHMFEATGHPDWIATKPDKFGLLSVAPPPALATAISLALLALAIGTAWLAWRYIEEPAREWSRRFANPHK
ncbi:acyltransferase [Qipengyuania soli]|uniref:Acyltransferase n=1 Tax=Qipengyuania soli TaxID=2782568 RepID=A0A7S8F4Z4_9SPHN|nr:acyltransferase [Qipengyuania soli]